MKKIPLLLCSLFLATNLFAAGVKTSDFVTETKFNKVLTEYNLSVVYDYDKTTVYKSDNTDDWIYVFKEGNEDNNDKNVYVLMFYYLDGKFDSCLKYSSFTSPKESKKYLYAVMSERSTAIPKEDYFSNGWHWTDPQQCFYHLFWRRFQVFSLLESTVDQYGISIPEADCERYHYFIKWCSEHSGDKDVKVQIQKEYKAYLKEHK